jgi:anaerobic magnesium-protoporphyrin IX monomethyl ester cyclase
MSDILFTHSYFSRFDPKQWLLGQPYAPLGTLYAASLMRENGYSVSLFDTMFVERADEILPALQRSQPRFLVVCDDGFNYLTKMCLTNMREAAFEMCKLAKQQGCTIIVSSSDSTDRYENYLLEGADFVIIGEVEQTLLALINQLKSKDNDFSKIHGIAFKTSQGILKTQNQNVIKDLDSLPMPAWDLVDMEVYRAKWLNHKGYFSINMSTTRGCPFKCNWCAKPIYGNRYNSRTPAHVVAEIRFLKQNFNMDHIWFCDDIFGLKPGWVLEFAKLLKKENIQIKFKIQSRADLLIDEDLVAALATAGCETVWIGAESGSQKILDAMDKGITLEQIAMANVLMKKYEIKPSFFIQFGYPGETKTDIALTINMINRLLPHEIGISVSYPLPGTKFYERVKLELKNKTNWTDSDEMALMFSNTYSSSYYKQLHAYVHRNYHQHIAKHNLMALVTNPLQITWNRLRKASSIVYYIPLTFLEKQKLNKLEREI